MRSVRVLCSSSVVDVVAADRRTVSWRRRLLRTLTASTTHSCGNCTPCSYSQNWILRLLRHSRPSRGVLLRTARPAWEHLGKEYKGTLPTENALTVFHIYCCWSWIKFVTLVLPLMRFPPGAMLMLMLMSTPSSTSSSTWGWCNHLRPTLNVFRHWFSFSNISSSSSLLFLVIIITPWQTNSRRVAVSD